MARELNRDLFGGAKPSPEPHGPAAGGDLLKLTLGLESVQRRVGEVDARTESARATVDEAARQTKLRFERVQGHFKTLDESIKNGFGDLNQKIARVASRVNERKISEAVVQGMVDRHAQIVQSFEVRLTQLQRLVADQDVQLIHARAELKNAMVELARLKKI